MVDPLAEALAGKRGMEAARSTVQVHTCTQELRDAGCIPAACTRRTWRAWLPLPDSQSMALQEYQKGVEDGHALAGASGRKFQVGRVTLRTLFFDRHLQAALRQGARQVVLLGAGMDSRAWRLELPPGEHLMHMCCCASPWIEAPCIGKLVPRAAFRGNMGSMYCRTVHPVSGQSVAEDSYM